MTLATSFFQEDDFIQVLYIVAFTLFIIGLRGVTSPKTARRGNVIAAVGMAIAVVATLLIPEVGDYGLIALGVAIGTAIGIPAARSVQMTQMPQMVALFNGVGGGAVALIAWAEFRRTGGDLPLEELIPILFAAIIGSISFWGSNIAFGKLQEILPGRPISLPGQQFVNGALLLIAVGCAVAIAAGSESELLFIAILVSAAVLGNMFVLPIGGADMPVVISLLNAFTGLSAAAAGIALDNTALIVGGIIVGASGSILTNLMAEAMSRSIPAIVAGGFGGVDLTSGGGEDGRPVRSTDASDAAIQLAYARQRRGDPGLRHGGGAGPARGARDGQRAGEARRGGGVRHPPGGRPHAGPHERAPGRGRRALRAAQGDGRHQPRAAADRRGAGDRGQRHREPRGRACRSSTSSAAAR